jgi:serine/threonine-protein kinase
MVGQTVGKYRVVSRLGRGGMGTVYKAVDETLDREVAIKSLNADLGDADLLKRFRAEAITLARLNHPNIATLFELTEHDGELLMVMEFVRGDTFDKVSQREGPMTVPRAGQLCTQVLDALEHAHRAGIVHRDLKPANMMLTPSGLVKVMDFGLARMMGTEHLTNDGYMVGTPAYMSPEQVLGREIDGRADLYAMGVVFFRLLTSQLPFRADSGIAMVHHQLNDQPTPVRQIRSELSESCETLIMRALAKGAGDRFQSAEEFKAALAGLDPAVAGAGVSRASAVVLAPPLSIAPSVDVEPEPTLPPTPTPLASSTAGLSPPTVVMARADSSPSAAVPDAAASAASEQSTTEAPTPADLLQAAGPPPVPPAPASEASVPPAAAGPAAPAVPPAPTPARSRAAATVSSSTPGTKTASRNPMIPGIAAAAVLVVAGTAAIFAWRAHRAAAPPAAAAAVATPAPAAPAPAPPVPAPVATSTSPAPAAVPPPDTSAPSSAAPVTAPSARASVPASVPARPTPLDTVTPVAEKLAARPSPPAARTATKTSAPPPPVAAARPARPNVTFGKLKLLIIDDSRTRDRDVALRLGPDALLVVDGATTVQTASYQDVIGVFYSHAREPRWTTPEGTTVPVGKTSGAFGFFRGTPDWITVRTRNFFIPLRVSEEDVHRITVELEARTGAKAVTTK